MLAEIVGVSGLTALFVGLALATVGLYGLLRKPDIFEQLHAAGLVTGPGTLLVLLASLASGNAEIVTSALLVCAFVLITSSLSTHAIALAAWRRRETATSGAGAVPGGDPKRGSRGEPASDQVAPRVLIAHDGSPEADVALRLVAGLRWTDGTVVRLVAAVEGDIRPFTSADGDAMSASGARAEDGPVELATALEAAVRSLARSTLTVDGVVRRGDPAAVVLEEAVAFRAGLVVVGSRGFGRVRSAVTGSVAAGVVDGAACPVLVARSTRLDDVLVATDGSEQGEAAIEVLARWSIFDEARIRVLNVQPAAPQRSGAAPPDAMRDAMATARRNVTEPAVARLLVAGRQAVSHVETGDPAATIIALAEAQSVGLIVVGTRGHTGLKRTLLGSVAREVLSSATTSVLVVRTPAVSTEG